MDDQQRMSRASEAYVARLDRTLKGLQARVKEQEAALEKLKIATAVKVPELDDSPAYLQHLRALKLAHETYTREEPGLPSPESPIPALLALRATKKVITETEECIAEETTTFAALEKRLAKEQADLRDARLMQSMMKSRISSLQDQIDNQSQKSPAQVAKELIRDLKQKQARYDNDTMKLIRDLNSFVDEHLAVMLAAEELGGPVVGEAPEVDESILEAGFNAQGKVRRSKSMKKDDQRQRRIDEIWGPRPQDGDEEEREPWNEKEGAAAEMRELTEQLLNSLVEAEGNGPGAYVDLSRESAAARFLVRSKAAQYHPKDARKLRLIDFGGGFES
ncbi:hypothetical protein BP5796_05980 [Coleophoma crateriformis]|uniref:Uncharacterized protein n=1 Tax=Coleophoma crateriformis TaxID=565419 RepID=A0A3D8RVV9_9HELO|nr:hypothetical protein BP5796_05980 [Coleophoma crateriformis]